MVGGIFAGYEGDELAAHIRAQSWRYRGRHRRLYLINDHRQPAERTWATSSI